MTILEQILAVKKDEIKQLRSRYRLRHFYDSVFFERPAKSLRADLKATGYPAVIAEVKKASPAAGVIRSDFDPLKMARIYAENGAAAVSVLTDKKFFQGDIAYLEKIAEISPLPLLRKDFILDEYQVFQSRRAGADAVLLIAAVLSAAQVAELTHAASEAGLEVLLEVHTVEELAKADLHKNRMIGINNRNLNDFSVDLAAGSRIKKELPAKTTTVAESGINSRGAVAAVKEAGVNGILVGEYLMRSADPARALRELIRWCRDAG